MRILLSRDNYPLLCSIAAVIACYLTMMGYHVILSGLGGVSDFTAPFVGAHLLGTSQIYDIKANCAVQRQYTGQMDPGMPFIALPFVAAAIKPFTTLPYLGAVAAWKIVLIAALAGTVVFFPYVPRRHVALALCCSVPVALSVGMGNSAPLVLVSIALSLKVWVRGNHFWAGVLLAVAIIKFQFLIFLPLLLFRREHRKLLAGFGLASAVLIAVNFAVQPDWIPLYWQALHLPQDSINPHPNSMPNLYSAFFWTGHPVLFIGLGALLISAILDFICWQFTYDVAMPLCVLGAVIVAPHSEAVPAIPALLTIAHRFPWLRGPALLLLSPFTVIIKLAPSLGPAVFVSICALLMVLVATPKRRFGAAQWRLERKA